MFEGARIVLLILFNDLEQYCKTLVCDAFESIPIGQQMAFGAKVRPLATKLEAGSIMFISAGWICVEM